MGPDDTRIFHSVINKMENENVTDIVVLEIDIITKEQTRLSKYHQELEDRRLRLWEFVQYSDKLELSLGRVSFYS